MKELPKTNNPDSSTSQNFRISQYIVRCAVVILRSVHTQLATSGSQLSRGRQTAMSSSSDASTATNGTNPLQYEPLRQTIVIVDRLGEEVPVSLENVNEFTHYGVKIGIVWGSQIGAALITLVLLLVLSRPEKRRSTLFVSNVLSLFLCIFRGITNVLYYTSNWYTLYVIATGDYSQIPLSDYVNSILATTTSLLLLICVEVSLVIQANIVCTTVKRPWRIAIMIISGLVAVAVIAVRLWQTILNNQMTMGEDVLGLDQVASLSSILLVTSICFFSLVFCCKLGLAIRNRRQLGLKQFGPMQIVFIMGTQTLIIPSTLPIFILGCILVDHSSHPCNSRPHSSPYRWNGIIHDDDYCHLLAANLNLGCF